MGSSLAQHTFEKTCSACGTSDVIKFISGGKNDCKTFLHVLTGRYGRLSGLAIMRGKFKCQGVPLLRIIIGHGSTVLAVGAGSSCFFLKLLSRPNSPI